jgi:hypothetical protein
MSIKPNLFIITSAFFVDGPGISGFETRIYQTLSTINSIKVNVNNAEILLMPLAGIDI